MGTHILDAFLVTFGLDARGFEHGEREVRESTTRLNEETKKSFDSMEERSEQLAGSLKAVRNEMVGLGLAVMGARSITDIVKNMVTGAASADRFGQSIGMSIQKVYAWRKALSSVGGENGDADAALQTAQNMRMGYIQGTLGNDQQFALARLGVSASDIEHGDAGSLLSKIAASSLRTSNPEMFASLLQQIGLNGPILYLLQKGQGSVDRLIASYEKDAAGQERLAKQSEELQMEMADLRSKIEAGLTPEVAQLVKVLNRIADFIGANGDRDPLNFSHDPKGYKNAWDYVGGWLGGDAGKWISDNMGAQGSRAAAGAGEKSKPSTAPAGSSDAISATPFRGGGRLTRAERNNNPGNITDGSFARNQPGYIGHDTPSRGHTMARFDTAEHGFQAMVKLLSGKAYAGSGIDTIASIAEKYAPRRGGNDPVAYALAVQRATHINRYQHLSQSQIAAVAAAMAKHEGFRGGITIQHMAVTTKDAASFPRDLRSHTRSAAVQADRGVAP